MLTSIFISLMANNIGYREVANFTNSVIVCAGNSLTEGYLSSNPAVDSYPAVLQTLSPFSGNGTVVNNEGVGGQTTQQMITNAAIDIDPLYDNSVLSVLIAWEIGNDLYFNGDVNGAQVRFQQYCEDRQAVGWTVISVTVSYRDHSVVNGGVSPAGDSDVVYNNKRETINNWLRTNYSSFSTILVDLDADPNLGAYNSTYFNPDRVHLSDAGYELVANLTSIGLLKL